MSTGKNGKKYGIAASPNTKTNNLSDWQTPQIDEEDLYQFAKSLPPGIRTKAIFAQCYGANTLESYLKGLQSNNGCGCGAASSDLNAESLNTGWEHIVLRNSQGKSFAKGISATRFREEDNISSTSSENYIYRYFLAKQKEFGITATSGEDLLRQSQLILAKATKKELSKEERDLVDGLVRVHESGYEEWMLKLDPSKTKQLLSYSGFDHYINYKETYGASTDPLIKEMLKSGRSQEILFLEKDSSREQIAKAFLLSASSEEKKAYRDLFRCEQDPLDTQNPTEQGGQAAPDKTGANKGVR